MTEEVTQAWWRLWLPCQGLQGQNQICPSKRARGQGHLRLTEWQRNANCMGKQMKWWMMGTIICSLHFLYILWKWAVQRCRPFLTTAGG